MDNSKLVLHLIHITINTLNAQYHSCRPHAAAGPLYSDNSNISRYSEKEKGRAKSQGLNLFGKKGGNASKVAEMFCRLPAVDGTFQKDSCQCSCLLYVLLHVRGRQCVRWVGRPRHPHWRRQQRVSDLLRPPEENRRQQVCEVPASGAERQEK